MVNALWKIKSVRLLDFLLLFIEHDNESLLDEMSKSELDSTSLSLIDLLEDAVLLNLSHTLFCLLFLECLVIGEDAPLLDETSESELDSVSLLLFLFTGGSCAFGLEACTLLSAFPGILGLWSLLPALLGRFGLWSKFIIENVFRGKSFQLCFVQCICYFILHYPRQAIGLHNQSLSFGGNQTFFQLEIACRMPSNVLTA